MDAAAPGGTISTATTNSSRLRGSLADRVEIILPILGYLIIVLLGATTSSIGMPELRQNPAEPLGTMWGDPQPIRSDEWLTAAPIELGVLELGSSTHSPLAHEPDLIYQISSGGLVESILFVEGNLLRLGDVLPHEMLFAAFRGSHFLMVLLAMPPLLRRLGATRPMSWLGVGLCVLAPASAWWSFMPVRVLGVAVVGCYLLVRARDHLEERRWWWSLPLACAGGLFLARLATYYVPWGLTIGVPIVIATGAYLVWSSPRSRRAGLIVLGVGAVAGIALLGGTWWENLDSLRAELDTAYPGLRRSTGQPQPPFLLFGAPGLFEMDGGPAPALHNQSELSQGYLICAVWAALLWGHMRPLVDRGQRIVLLVLGGSTLVLASWITLSWGRLGEALPLANLVPPMRVAQTIGLTASVLLVLVLSHLAEPVRTRTAVFVGVVCAFITAYAVSDLKNALPTLSSKAVLGVSLITGLAVWAVTRYRTSWIPVAATCTLALGAVLTVNPVLFGLGDLRESAAAETVRELGVRTQAEGGLVATDSGGVAALLVANAVPSITGYQVTGPQREAWANIDPDSEYEEEWNRGASYLRVTLDGRPGSEPVITNPSLDVISVSVDPCWLTDAKPDIKYLITASPVPNKCTTRVDEMTWSGVEFGIYELA